MDFRSLFLRNLYLLVRPIVRIALRHGITAGDVVATVKRAMVDVCASEYGIRGRPTSKSRIAAMTDMSRAEVARLLEVSGENSDGESSHPISILVGIWLRESEWHDSRGKPAVLDLDVVDGGFQKLARQASSAVPYQTLLREITRLGIARQKDDKIELVKHGFIPGDGEENLLRFLGEDAAALIDTVAFNMQNAGSEVEARRYQRKASFLDLTDEGMNALNAIAQNQGQLFLEATDQQLSKYRSPECGEKRRLRGMGIYVFDLDQSRTTDHE